MRAILSMLQGPIDLGLEDRKGLCAHDDAPHNHFFLSRAADPARAPARALRAPAGSDRVLGCPGVQTGYIGNRSIREHG